MVSNTSVLIDGSTGTLAAVSPLTFSDNVAHSQVQSPWDMARKFFVGGNWKCVCPYLISVNLLWSPIRLPVFYLLVYLFDCRRSFHWVRIGSFEAFISRCALQWSLIRCVLDFVWSFPLQLSWGHLSICLPASRLNWFWWSIENVCYINHKDLHSGDWISDK